MVLKPKSRRAVSHIITSLALLSIALVVTATLFVTASKTVDETVQPEKTKSALQDLRAASFDLGYSVGYESPFVSSGRATLTGSRPEYAETFELPFKDMDAATLHLVTDLDTKVKASINDQLLTADWVDLTRAEAVELDMTEAAKARAEGENSLKIWIDPSAGGEYKVDWIVQQNEQDIAEELEAAIEKALKTPLPEPPAPEPPSPEPPAPPEPPGERGGVVRNGSASFTVAQLSFDDLKPCLGTFITDCGERGEDQGTKSVAFGRARGSSHVEFSDNCYLTADDRYPGGSDLDQEFTESSGHSYLNTYRPDSTYPHCLGVKWDTEGIKASAGASGTALEVWLSSFNTQTTKLYSLAANILDICAPVSFDGWEFDHQMSQSWQITNEVCTCIENAKYIDTPGGSYRQSPLNPMAFGPVDGLCLKEVDTMYAPMAEATFTLPAEQITSAKLHLVADADMRVMVMVNEQINLHNQSDWIELTAASPFEVNILDDVLQGENKLYLWVDPATEGDYQIYWVVQENERDISEELEGAIYEITPPSDIKMYLQLADSYFKDEPAYYNLIIENPMKEPVTLYYLTVWMWGPDGEFHASQTEFTNFVVDAKGKWGEAHPIGFLPKLAGEYSIKVRLYGSYARELSGSITVTDSVPPEPTDETSGTATFIVFKSSMLGHAPCVGSAPASNTITDCTDEVKAGSQEHSIDHGTRDVVIGRVIAQDCATCNPARFTGYSVPEGARSTQKAIELAEGDGHFLYWKGDGRESIIHGSNWATGGVPLDAYGDSESMQIELRVSGFNSASSDLMGLTESLLKVCSGKTEQHAEFDIDYVGDIPGQFCSCLADAKSLWAPESGSYNLSDYESVIVGEGEKTCTKWDAVTYSPVQEKVFSTALTSVSSGTLTLASADDVRVKIRVNDQWITDNWSGIFTDDWLQISPEPRNLDIKAAILPNNQKNNIYMWVDPKIGTGTYSVFWTVEVQ